MTKNCDHAVIPKILGSDSQRRKFIDIEMNNNYVRYQLNTGSDLSIISENTRKKIARVNVFGGMGWSSY